MQFRVGDDLNKKEIRSAVLTQMREQDKALKHANDAWLHDALLQHDDYQHANTVGVVLSMPHEVDTYGLIETAMKDGKHVYVPETDYARKEMHFKRLLDLNDIGLDEKGINHVTTQTEINDTLDLVIVPGVAFNDAGYRIGYGGGYFDRFLSQHPPKHTISLLYDFQLSDIPVAAHDIPVETQIIKATQSGRSQ